MFSFDHVTEEEQIKQRQLVKAQRVRLKIGYFELGDKESMTAINTVDRQRGARETIRLMDSILLRPNNTDASNTP